MTMHSGVHFDDSVLGELVRNMGKVAGVLHLVPADFVSRVSFAKEEDEIHIVMLRNWSPVTVSEPIVDLSSDADEGCWYLRVVNKCQEPLTEFALAINTNAVGLVIDGEPIFPDELAYGEVVPVKVPVKFDSEAIGNRENAEMQIALRTSAGNIFGFARVPVERATTDAGNIGQEKFRQCYVQWQAMLTVAIPNLILAKPDKLKERKVVVVGENRARKQITFALTGGEVFVGKVSQVGLDVIAKIKALEPTLLPLVQASLEHLLGHSQI
jgi:hypothetical protein